MQFDLIGIKPLILDPSTVAATMLTHRVRSTFIEHLKICQR